MTGLKEKIELDMDCANCGQPAVAGSSLCVDCLVACNSKTQGRLENQIIGSERNMKNLADIVAKKEDELICLRAQLRLTRRLMRHVFAEYQKLLKLQGVNGGKAG